MAIVCPQSNGNRNAYFDVLAFIGENKNFKAKSILQRFTNLNELLDNTKKTLLHISAKCGNATITQFLIESGSKVNAQDSNGETPLMLVPSRAALTANILLDANACMHMTDTRGLSALNKLVKNCRAEWSSLHENREILQVFYERMKRDYSKEMIAKKLCEADCPLPVVILLSDSELTRCMLENGCALDERAHGMTALHVAVRMSDFNNVILLLTYGADVNGTDRHEETPLCKYRTDTEDTTEKVAILKVLLNQAASLSAMVTVGSEYGYRGELIVKRLLVQGQKDTVFTLLQNIDLLAKYGASCQTALHFLAQNVDPAVEHGIRFLINKGVDVNARDKKGRSAVTIAVAKGLTSRVAFLMANGGKVNIVDIVEKTSMVRELMRKSGFREYEDNSSQKHYAKVFKMILGYEVDFQSAPEKLNCLSNKNLILIKLALAYVVIAENDGRVLSNSIQKFIESRHVLQDYYNLCKKQLEDIKTMTIHGSVTAYKLLTESDEKLVNYVCNQKLISDFNCFLRTNVNRDSYYHFIMQRRVGKAIKTAKLRDEGATAICKITGLPANEHRHVVNKIVSYMSGRDFRMLFQVTRFM